MRRIESQLDVNSEAFRLNREHNQRLAAELRERERRARYERPSAISIGSRGKRRGPAASQENNERLHPAEIAYVQSQRSGRVTTVRPNGQPHVAPVASPGKGPEATDSARCAHEQNSHRLSFSPEKKIVVYPF
jgi:hypothetical protein